MGSTARMQDFSVVYANSGEHLLDTSHGGKHLEMSRTPLVKPLSESLPLHHVEALLTIALRFRPAMIRSRIPSPRLETAGRTRLWFQRPSSLVCARRLSS